MANYLEDPILVHEDDYIKVLCVDAQGSGGAHHVYQIYDKTETNEEGTHLQILMEVKFQEGPILENGVNGGTNEALLAIVAHRLECFQAGPFPSRPNAIAGTHTDTALLWLESRTKDRQKRGVEGKSEA